MTELPVSFAKDTSAACVAELLQGRGRDIPSFLYLFMDTFVGGGLVINSHLHRGLHGNAGAVASLPLSPAQPSQAPAQLISQASLWELEQRFREHGLDPMAAYDKRVLQAPWLEHSRGWIARALRRAWRTASSRPPRFWIWMPWWSMAPQPPSCCRPCARAPATRWPTTTGKACTSRPGWSWYAMGSDARALGGALLPLHACFAPDTDIFLKA